VFKRGDLRPGQVKKVAQDNRVVLAETRRGGVDVPGRAREAVGQCRVVVYPCLAVLELLDESRGEQGLVGGRCSPAMPGGCAV
jgi:hypothetical protein